MKIYLLFLFMLWAFMAVGQTADLTITFTGLDKVSGHIQVAVYKDPATFPKSNQQYKLVRFKVTSMNPTCKIEDLPLGTYAVAMMKDENGDGICNLNFIGIPIEAYGFSNNVKPTLKVPSFDSAKILLQEDRAISIKLQF